MLSKSATKSKKKAMWKLHLPVCWRTCQMIRLFFIGDAQLTPIALKKGIYLESEVSFTCTSVGWGAPHSAGFTAVCACVCILLSSRVRPFASITWPAVSAPFLARYANNPALRWILEAVRRRGRREGASRRGENNTHHLSVCVDVFLLPSLYPPPHIQPNIQTHKLY